MPYIGNGTNIQTGVWNKHTNIDIQKEATEEKNYGNRGNSKVNLPSTVYFNVNWSKNSLICVMFCKKILSNREKILWNWKISRGISTAVQLNKKTTKKKNLCVKFNFLLQPEYQFFFTTCQFNAIFQSSYISIISKWLNFCWWKKFGFIFMKLQ